MKGRGRELERKYDRKGKKRVNIRRPGRKKGVLHCPVAIGR